MLPPEGGGRGHRRTTIACAGEVGGRDVAALATMFLWSAAYLDGCFGVRSLVVRRPARLFLFLVLCRPAVSARHSGFLHREPCASVCLQHDASAPCTVPLVVCPLATHGICVATSCSRCCTTPPKQKNALLRAKPIQCAGKNPNTPLTSQTLPGRLPKPQRQAVVASTHAIQGTTYPHPHPPQRGGPSQAGGSMPSPPAAPYVDARLVGRRCTPREPPQPVTTARRHRQATTIMTPKR